MDCWYFAGRIRKNGYGGIQVKMPHKWQEVDAHRIMYENFVGPIPDGFVVDHICRVRSCVNPDHLQAISDRENVALGWLRKTHCKQGHEWTPENTGYRSNGARRCKSCQAIHQRNRRLKLRSL